VRCAASEVQALLVFVTRALALLDASYQRTAASAQNLRIDIAIVPQGSKQRIHVVVGTQAKGLRQSLFHVAIHPISSQVRRHLSATPTPFSAASGIPDCLHVAAAFGRAGLCAASQRAGRVLPRSLARPADLVRATLADGTVAEVLAKPGTQVDARDLLIVRGWKRTCLRAGGVIQHLHVVEGGDPGGVGGPVGADDSQAHGA